MEPSRLWAFSLQHGTSCCPDQVRQEHACLRHRGVCVYWGRLSKAGPTLEASRNTGRIELTTWEFRTSLSLTRLT